MNRFYKTLLSWDLNSKLHETISIAISQHKPYCLGYTILFTRLLVRAFLMPCLHFKILELITCIRGFLKTPGAFTIGMKSYGSQVISKLSLKKYCLAHETTSTRGQEMESLLSLPGPQCKKHKGNLNSSLPKISSES